MKENNFFQGKGMHECCLPLKDACSIFTRVLKRNFFLFVVMIHAHTSTHTVLLLFYLFFIITTTHPFTDHHCG